MATTQVQYTGDGSTQDFVVPFPYLAREDVKVSLNGTLTSAYTWLTGSIRFDTAPSNGTIIDIQRQTPDDTPLIDFNDKTIWTADDMDTVILQLLYIAQEAMTKAGGTLSVLPDGSYSASLRRIANVGAPQQPGDAVNLQWAQGTFIPEIQGYLTSAISARDAAITAKNQAQASATGAATSAGTASSAAISAETYRDAADSFAADANDAKLHAQGYRDSAESAASEALGYRNQAESFRDVSVLAATDAEAARDTAINARDDAEGYKNTAGIAAADAQTSAQEAALSAEDSLTEANRAQQIVDDFDPGQIAGATPDTTGHPESILVTNTTAPRPGMLWRGKDEFKTWLGIESGVPDPQDISTPQALAYERDSGGMKWLTGAALATLLNLARLTQDANFRNLSSSGNVNQNSVTGTNRFRAATTFYKQAVFEAGLSTSGAISAQGATFAGDVTINGELNNPRVLPAFDSGESNKVLVVNGTGSATEWLAGSTLRSRIGAMSDSGDTVGGNYTFTGNVTINGTLTNAGTLPSYGSWAANRTLSVNGSGTGVDWIDSATLRSRIGALGDSGGTGNGAYTFTSGVTVQNGLSVSSGDVQLDQELNVGGGITVTGGVTSYNNYLVRSDGQPGVSFCDANGTQHAAVGHNIGNGWTEFYSAPPGATYGPIAMGLNAWNRNYTWYVLSQTYGIPLRLQYGATDLKIADAVTGQTIWSNQGSSSDARLKKDVRDIRYGLEAVERMRPVEFKYKSPIWKDQNQVGLIAQELCEVVPEVTGHETPVNPDTDPDDGFMYVRYDLLTPVLVRAVQELSAKVDALQNRLEALEGPSST